jgi:hypothetical protein
MEEKERERCVIEDPVKRDRRQEKKVLKPFAHRVFALTFAAPISSF